MSWERFSYILSGDFWAYINVILYWGCEGEVTGPVVRSLLGPPLASHLWSPNLDVDQLTFDWTEITLPPPPPQIYPDEAHGLYGVTRHLYETMEAFLDEIFGPIEDYFVNDYYLAAAKLLEVDIY